MADIPFRIEQRMTRPSRPGKAPRLVYVAVGATAGYEIAFRDAGGRLYRGEWSFWENPTEALAEAERASFADRQEDDRARAAERAARYEDYADHAATRATAAHATADAIYDAIPFGQPILVGHHSEQADRNRRDRAWNALGRSVEENKRADYWAGRAATAARAATKKPNVPFMMRRLEEARTASRLTQATIDGTRQMYAPVPATGAWLVTLQVRLAEEQERVAYWEAAIAAAGGVRFSADTIKKGDAIDSWAGPRRTVLRVNVKSVTIQDWWHEEGRLAGRFHRRTISYDAITAHYPQADGEQSALLPTEEGTA